VSIDGASLKRQTDVFVERFLAQKLTKPSPVAKKLSLRVGNGNLYPVSGARTTSTSRGVALLFHLAGVMPQADARTSRQYSKIYRAIV
jgi:hypothetical protein